MSEELLPCPFCGKPGDIESRPSYSQAAATYFAYRGWCDHCGFGLEWDVDERDAIAAWNRRPALIDHLEADGGVEAMRATLERIAEGGGVDFSGRQIVFRDYDPRVWARECLSALPVLGVGRKPLDRVSSTLEQEPV